MTDSRLDTTSGLFTDLYELTMMQSYFDRGMDDPAAFSLFVRRLPATRNFLLACGIDAVLDGLERLRFSDGDIAYLASLDLFTDAFLDHLRGFRFTGAVHAVAEGSVVFANEPIIEIVAPIGQGQLVETLVMNRVHVATVLASKAVRVVTAARGRAVIDFGARRMHGLDAALTAARAFHIAGVDATSNVLAGQRYAIPVSGTMAHSYIEAFDDEAEAFAAFTRSFPETVLLVDTYDTLAGVGKVIDLARRLGDAFKVRAIRLDSGDLYDLAIKARALLDAAGLDGVSIFASGGLDESEIARLLDRGAPIDGFGVGTAMGVSEDAPSLDLAYKLCAYAGRGRSKLSPGKPILPGRKQVFRTERGDVIARSGETLPGRPLLRPVMQDGRRVPGTRDDLDAIRARAAAEVAALPAAVRALEPAAEPYPVDVSADLAAYRDAVIASLQHSS